MKRQLPAFILLIAFLAIAWGIFLVEDGLFNTGATDFKEFGIGLAFFILAFIFTLVIFYAKRWFVRVSPWFGISTFILISVIYAGSVYLRWQNHEIKSEIVTGTDMIVGHVEASNEWIMVDRSLLQRPAHWYESGVRMTYLADDEQQSLSIRLPAKYLPLKSIKEM